MEKTPSDSAAAGKPEKFYHQYGFSEEVDLIEKTEPELAQKLREAKPGDSQRFSNEEIERLKAASGEKFASLCHFYTAARWGNKNGIEWEESSDGKRWEFRQENHAAGAWWILSDEERKDFYFNLNEEDAAKLVEKKRNKINQKEENGKTVRKVKIR